MDPRTIGDYFLLDCAVENRTYYSWHVYVEGLPPGIHYSWRLDGPDEWRTAQYDGRWARCRRPFIFTGGELTLKDLTVEDPPIEDVIEKVFANRSAEAA